MPVGPTELLVGLEVAGLGAVTCSEVEDWSLQPEAATEEAAAPPALAGHSWWVACTGCTARARLDPAALFGATPATASLVVAWLGPAEHLRLELDQDGLARVLRVHEGVQVEHWQTRLVPPEEPAGAALVENLADRVGGVAGTAADAARLARAWTLEAAHSRKGLVVSVRDLEDELARGVVPAEALDGLEPDPPQHMPRVAIATSGAGAGALLTVAAEGAAVPLPRLVVDAPDGSVVAAVGRVLEGGLPVELRGPWEGAGCTLAEPPQRDDGEAEREQAERDDEDGGREARRDGAGGIGGLSAPGLPSLPGGVAGVGGPALPGGGAGGGGGSSAGSPGSSGGGSGPAQARPEAAGPAQPSLADPPAAPGRSPRITASPAMALGGVVALAGAGIGLDLARAQRSEAEEPGLSADEVDRRQSSATTATVISAGLGLGAVGLGVGALLIGRW